MALLFLPMPGNEDMAARLAANTGGEVGRIEVRHFPDGESYVRVATPAEDRNIAIVESLFNPDTKTLPMIFAACAARDLGARRTGLVAPYLGYMRQDARFKPGEAITSTSYANLLSHSFDWLATVDPHLHRIKSLSEVYSIPSVVCPAAPDIADWVRASVNDALVIGPDSESSQWASQIAERAGCPFVTLGKTRHGDRDVEIVCPDLSAWANRTPVITDDIISTGHTIETVLKKLAAKGFPPATVIGVHGLFAGDAADRLRVAGARAVVTTNTVPGPTSAIDISGALARTIAPFL